MSICNTFFLISVSRFQGEVLVRIIAVPDHCLPFALIEMFHILALLSRENTKMKCN